MACLLCFASCNNYLDLVPDDGIASLDNAFTLRVEAKKYLYTCYSYMPHDGDVGLNPAILGGDEMWTLVDAVENTDFNSIMLGISRGFQNAGNPIGEYWTSLYQGIRACNIFLENVEKVPDLDAFERVQWIAEVNFLKAYYHFYLVRMYGPVPIVRENLSIDASPAEVRVSRTPADECFDYIVELLDEAMPDLPLEILSIADELGRITQPIAAALKAKVLVTAASALFNGNYDQATLVNKDGTKLFNPEVKKEKWDAAVVACREAIEICHKANIHLYHYNAAGRELSDTLKLDLTLRNLFTEKWNSEVIWAETLTPSAVNKTLQLNATASLSTPYYYNPQVASQLQPTIKIAKLYYTNHGIPIDEDKFWTASNLYALRTGTDAEKYYIKKDYTTVELHFNREPRFYANLGFDGGIWYGQGRLSNNPDELYYIPCRGDGTLHKPASAMGPFTGYYWKKAVWYQNTINGLTGNDYSWTRYPWIIMRLADLYLLYAEAINEAEGPDGANSADLFRYINEVRTRAGLEEVKDSYDKYAKNVLYNNQTGMRQIIHRERLIELSLEGQRFWDLRRWKEAPDEYQKPMEAYKVTEADPEKFYQRVVVNQQNFSVKDYFWPIQTSVIENNPNIKQNIGW
jgi:hypothetical protein